MELRQLRTFAMAAELESFTRAAEAMAITQPAVSQQVASLEHELGVALFQRRGGRITLSDAGRHLYRYARQAIDLLDDASREIAEAPKTVTGTVQIATCTIPPETFLPQLLAAFRQVYPDVCESVSVSDTAEATRAIESGNADVGFVVAQPQGARLRGREIASQELKLVVAPDHSLASLERVTPDDLRCEPFVLRKHGSGTRQCVEAALQQAGISPSELTIVLETNSNDAVRGAVKAGSGIAFLSSAAVEEDIHQGRLAAVHVDGLRARLKIYLVTDVRRMPTPAVCAFLRFLERT